MEWPQGSEPRWPMDLLLAHRVVSPVVEYWQDGIKLWRIHRRAARDQAGHQFSFLFYSSPETARTIFDFIKNDRIIVEMKSRGLILRDSYDDTSEIRKPGVEDTCDSRWSVQIQKSWPYFAMGASRMWLQLIAETAGAMPDSGKATAPPEILKFYSKVDEAIKSTWQNEGSHAFLHHLNAIFGYEPIMVMEKRMVTF